LRRGAFTDTGAELKDALTERSHKNCLDPALPWAALQAVATFEGHVSWSAEPKRFWGFWDLGDAPGSVKKFSFDCEVRSTSALNPSIFFAERAGMQLPA
jgi:hypothetical protein